MRVFTWLALLVALLVAPSAQAAGPVSIRIQVIEATTKSKAFDKRLAPLKKAIRGYTGAKLIDALNTQISAGSSVSLEILKRSQVLKVTLQEVLKDSVKLTVEIEKFNFKATTTHKKGEATVVVAHETGPDTALFFAVTPRL